MNLSGIDNIPYKDKKALLHGICLMYKKFKVTKDFIEQKKLGKPELNDVIIEGVKQTFNSISLFETIMNLIGPNHSLIIKKDFIENEKNVNWYDEYWSKSTYYKLKHEAINQFLFLFYV